MYKDIFLKIIRFLNIIAFWFLIYTFLLIVHLLFFGIGVEDPPYLGEPLFPAFIEFLFEMSLLIYSPLYILPLLSIPLIKKLTASRDEHFKKLFLYILPIVLSLLIFLLHALFMYFISVFAHDISYPFELLPVSLILQILGCIVISRIYDRDNTILLKTTGFIFIFFLGAVIYFFVFGRLALGLPGVVEDLTKQAIETRDPVFCERIKEEGTKRWDIWVPWNKVEICFEKIIKITNDPEICSRVKRKTIMGGKCFFRAALYFNNSELCERIPFRSEKDECFKELAQQLNNPQLCEKIEIDFKNADCFEALALQLNNSELCEKTSIYYPARVNSCLEMLAKLNNPDLCENIGESRKCFRDAAVYSKNPQLCERIKEPSYGWKDECFISLASKLNDPQLCERVTKEEKKRECFEKFE